MEKNKGGMVNDKFDYFVLNKNNNKILFGFDWSEKRVVDTLESLKSDANLFLEMNIDGFSKKDYSILSANTLKSMGIDPYSWSNWNKETYDRLAKKEKMFFNYAKGGKVMPEWSVTITSDSGDTYDWVGHAKDEDDALNKAEKEAKFESVESGINMITDENGKSIDYAKGGGVKEIDYADVYPILKDKIDNVIDDIPFENAFDGNGEEVEHRSRDGFWAYTDGGYEYRWFEYVSYMNGSGKSLPTKPLDAELDRQVQYNYDLAKETFIDNYPEIVEELGEDKINYNDLYEAGYQMEAEELSEMEMNYDGDDTIMMRVFAYYYSPENSRAENGKHTISLFGDVNLESPYHRAGNLDDSMEITFTFTSLADLSKKMDTNLKKIVAWFKGDYYNKSKKEMKIRRMGEGGHTQGYDDREDERLSMEHGKISDKDFVGSHEQREHSRRDDARFEKRMAWGGFVTDLKNAYASDDMLEELKSKMKEGEPIVAFAYTDYGGDFFDKVAIEYFIENYPNNIVYEHSAYNGKNGIVFGKPAMEFLDATDKYLLGFDDIETYYYDMQYKEEIESFKYFLKYISSDYRVSKKALDWLLENRSGYYSMMTTGLDFSYEDLTNDLLEEGLITKKKMNGGMMAKGGKVELIVHGKYRQYSMGTFESKAAAKRFVEESDLKQPYTLYTLKKTDGGMMAKGGKTKELELLVDSHHGIYVPKVFVENYDLKEFGFNDDDIAYFKKAFSDPSSDDYFDAYEEMERKAITKDGSTITTADGDLWLVPKGYEYDDFFYGELGGETPNEKLRVKFVVVDVHKDSYEEGETDYVNGYSMNEYKGFTLSPSNILDFLENKLYLSGNANDYIVMDDTIRYDRLVDADSSPLSESELELWREGKLEAYNEHWTISFDAISERPITEEELSKFTGIQIYARGGYMAKGGSVSGVVKKLMEKYEKKYGYKPSKDELHSLYTSGQLSLTDREENELIKYFGEYAKGGKVGDYDNIRKTNTITEREVALIMRRLNSGKDDKETKEIVNYIWDNKPSLTSEQNKKGFDFLYDLWKSPSGKERKNNPFGYREQDVLENFVGFELSGFYDASRYGQRPYYIPLYIANGKDGSFEYYYSNGEVNIVGGHGGMFKRGGKVKYIPNRDIKSLTTKSGKVISQKDLLDGAYVNKSVKLAHGGSVGGFDYKKVDTSTDAGLKRAEKLQSQGWEVVSGSMSSSVTMQRAKKPKKKTKMEHGGEMVDVSLYAKGGVERIANNESKTYTENLIPFKANNLEAKTLDNGDYVVLSFGYYPIWWHCKKENKWYGNKDKYSQTTAKQMSQSRPTYDAEMLGRNDLEKKMMNHNAMFEVGGVLSDVLAPTSNAITQNVGGTAFSNLDLTSHLGIDSI